MLAGGENDGDTIVAPATAPGPAALAVVRLSGPAAGQIVAALAPGRRQVPSHRLVRACLRDGAGGRLDDAMVCEMHAPRSYTGEAMAELYLHGSPAVVAAVLAACTALGARLAAPGEFTRRALVAGRLDLVQAEAVRELTLAASQDEAAAAQALLAGQMSQTVNQWATTLERVVAAWQARVDFPDELGAAGGGLGDGDGDDVPPEGATAAERAALADVSRAIAAAQAGPRLAVDAARQVVLAGAPNAGKSTLLNAWAGEERALVDAVAGTTRDAIEIVLVDAPGRWSAVDTAGLRPGAEGLEARGGAQAQAWARRASLVLWLHAADRPWVPPPALGPAPLWVVISRADLARGAVDVARRAAAAAGHVVAGAISARAHEGTAALRERVVAHLGAARPPGPVVRQRHRDQLAAASAALGRAAAILEAMPAGIDLAADAVRAAQAALGALLGRDLDAATLDRIFAEFCIGK